MTPFASIAMEVLSARPRNPSTCTSQMLAAMLTAMVEMLTMTGTRLRFSA